MGMGGMDLKGMTADQLMSALQKTPRNREKNHGGTTENPNRTATLAPHVESSPRGAYPGRTRATPGERGGVDRERARRFGFQPNNILVLVDGTENSQKAIDAALHYRRRNDHIFFCHAVQTPGVGAQHEKEVESLELKGEKIIDDVKTQISEREIGRWETCVIPSPDIHNAVIEYATKNKIDIIFIATMHRPPNDLFPTDSMGKWIMENSTCSTM